MLRYLGEGVPLQMTDELANRLRLARQALRRNDCLAAVRHIQGGLMLAACDRGYIESSAVRNRSSFVRVLRAFGQIEEQIGNADAARATAAAAASPDVPDILLALGDRLRAHEDVSALASTVLLRAYRFAPRRHDVLTALGTALLQLGANQTARVVLEAAPDLLEANFVLRYLAALHAILCGNLARAETINLEATDGDAIESGLAAQIWLMVERAGLAGPATGPVSDDLRGWHYTLTGGVVTNLSPVGFESMHGRWGILFDTYEACRDGILRANAVLRCFDVRPTQVVALRDRSSRILATAAGKLLDLPVVELEREDTPGLVVAYDLAAQPKSILDALRQKRPGQVLLAHATCWTRTPTFAPDLTTGLYQTSFSPWGCRPRTGKPGGKPILKGTVPADESPVAIIAERIVQADGPADSLDHVETLVRAVQSFVPLATACLPSAVRGRMFRGGRVASAEIL